MIDPPGLRQSIEWCWRMHRWLDLHDKGALSQCLELPFVIECLSEEAIEGERVAVFLPPGPARDAALRIVHRLDVIAVELTDELLVLGTPH